MAHHFYTSKLNSLEDLENFLGKVSQTTTHEWVLYFAIYYSSWTGSMVLQENKVFAAFDQVIIQCTLEAPQIHGACRNQLQNILRDIVNIIGFDKWKKLLGTLNINRNIGILKERYVYSSDNILNLDVIEARHQLDNLVCYSGLKDTTFYDLQKGLNV